MKIYTDIRQFEKITVIIINGLKETYERRGTKM